MPEQPDDILEQITSSEYKYGFVTNIEADEAPKGLSEEYRTFHFGEEERTVLDVGVPTESISSLAKNGRTKMGECHLPYN